MSNFISSTNTSSSLSSLNNIAPLARPPSANIGALVSDALEQALTPHQSFLSADDRLALRDLMQATPPTPHIYQQISGFLKQQKGLEGVNSEDVKMRLESMVNFLDSYGNNINALSKYPYLRSALRKQQMDAQLNEFAIKGLTLNPSSTIDRFTLKNGVIDKAGNQLRELDSETAQMIGDALYVVANKSPTFRGAVSDYADHSGFNSLGLSSSVGKKINITVIDDDKSGLLGVSFVGSDDILLYMSEILRSSKKEHTVEFNDVKVSALLTATLAHEVGHAAAAYKDGKLGGKLEEGPNQHFTHRVGKEIDPKNINTLSIDGNGVPGYASAVWSR